MKKNYLLLFFALQFVSIQAQKNNFAITEELRGVWLGTAFNNDWPSEAGLSSEQQKKELINYFNFFEKMSINAVFFQVRPMGDAFYPSKTEPWSRYLTGISGNKPTPYYDPLAFALKLAKEKNIELHAWFNPFRALIQNKWDNTDFFYSKYKVYQQHPQWFVDYGNRKYFNPGIPEVRKYIISVIMEVVRNYAIAGVHFDDYFYPYPQKDQPAFNDIKTFYKYRENDQNIKDWRRHNINEFIRELRDSINSYNPSIQLGVAPPAVWRNIGFDEKGSSTKGLSAYDDLFADTRKWLAEGWVDYLVPQMYAEIGNKYGDFTTLAKWWNKNYFDRHIYGGIALYRLDKNSRYKAWQSPKQIEYQLNILRQMPAFKGEVFFSAKNLLQNPLQMSTLLAENYYNLPAQTPSMWWKQGNWVLSDSIVYSIDEKGNKQKVNTETKYIRLSSISNFHIDKKGKEIFLFWNWKANYKCTQQVVFEIYKFTKKELPIPDKNHLVASSLKNEIALSIKKHLFKRKYVYLVKVKCGIFESLESEAIHIRY